VNLGAFATALGAKTYRIEKPEELAEKLKAAIADVQAGTTCVVDVLTTRINATLTRLWDKTTPARKGE
jgi:thiamine pyrophosphate-dependent acetolactate synthase large subunit-like protein